MLATEPSWSCYKLEGACISHRQNWGRILTALGEWQSFVNGIRAARIHSGVISLSLGVPSSTQRATPGRKSEPLETMVMSRLQSRVFVGDLSLPGGGGVMEHINTMQ